MVLSTYHYYPENKGSEYFFYPYMEAYSILKYNNVSEGINLVSLYEKDKFEKYIIEKFYDKEDGIYIGNKLALKLVECGCDVVLVTRKLSKSSFN